MSDEGADSLAKALAVNRSLQELQISNSKISDNGIASIATALQTNITITNFWICYCSMSVRGLQLSSHTLHINLCHHGSARLVTLVQVILPAGKQSSVQTSNDNTRNAIAAPILYLQMEVSCSESCFQLVTTLPRLLYSFLQSVVTHSVVCPKSSGNMSYTVVTNIIVTTI